MNAKQLSKRMLLALATASLITGSAFAIPAATFNTYDKVVPAYQEVLKTSPIGQLNIGSDEELATVTANAPKAFYGAFTPETYIVPSDAENPAVPLYVYKPTNVQAGETLPVLYYSHGGGYILRGALFNTEFYQQLADRFHMLVVAERYRLTDEAPFPAALIDAYRGLTYTHQNVAQWGGNPNQIITMGDSAGGGLSAVLGLYNKDHANVPLKGEILIYPMLDSRTAGPNDPYKAPNTGEYVWTRTSNVYAWSTIGDYDKVPDGMKVYFSPVQYNNPEALKGLPPTYIYAGDLDLFVNEDLAYTNLLSQAGVPVKAHIEPGLYHNFFNMVLEGEQTKEFWAEIQKQIQTMLAK